MRHLNPKVLDYFKEIVQLTQYNFPSPIKRLIVIRAPRIFQIGWNAIKHIIPSTTRDKMLFLGSSGYLEVLDKYIDINILPPCINEGGAGETAVGMMKQLEGVEPVQAYLERLPADRTEETTEEESVSSDGSSSPLISTVVGVRSKLLVGGSQFSGTDVGVGVKVLLRGSFPLRGSFL